MEEDLFLQNLISSLPNFYQGNKKRQCELIPQDLSKLKEVKEELLDNNNDDIPIRDLKIPCRSCGKRVKPKHKYCKHCGFEIKNEKAKKKAHYYP